MAEILSTITYRQRQILMLHFGLGDGYNYTLNEMGHIFKLTHERVRQIEAKAVRKLQAPERAKELCGFID